VPSSVDFMDEPEHRPHAGQQFDLIDRLGDVIHRAGGERELELNRVCLDGHHDDGRIPNRSFV
jgi:hypothetical protein